MNHQETIESVVKAANKSKKPDFNTMLAIRDDPTLKGRIWAYSPVNNEYSAEATMQGLIDDDLRGRTEFNIDGVDYILKTYNEMMALQNTEAKGTQPRYLPGSDKPLVRGDHGFELTDEKLMQLHFIMASQPNLDQWQTIEDLLDGKLRRYQSDLVRLADLYRTDKVAYSQWQNAIYQATRHRPFSHPVGQTFSTSSGPVDRIALREDINRYFSLDEIESLCFDIGVNFENIGGSSKPGKVLELIQYMERRGQLDDLHQAAKRARFQVR